MPRPLRRYRDRVDLASHDLGRTLMEAADALPFGGGYNATAAAENRNNRVDLGGDLIANVLKDAGFKLHGQRVQS